MARAKGRDWTRDETTKVLALYCQMAFGQMDAKNKIVIEMAKSLGRTPGSIAYKLVNFASLDPFHRARGIAGMGNTSALDRDVWKEYFGQWAALAELSVPLMEPLLKRNFFFKDEDDAASQTESLRLQKYRRGQQFFRNAVLAAYQFKCCVTGIATPELLRASHIMPWSHNRLERLNPHNGLCLNSLHDAAFDSGLITFTADVKLTLSKRLKEQVPQRVYTEMFARFENSSPSQPEKFPPLEAALAYHRETLFQK